MLSTNANIMKILQIIDFTKVRFWLPFQNLRLFVVQSGLNLNFPCRSHLSFTIGQ
jgi:hypothetical protein